MNIQRKHLADYVSHHYLCERTGKWVFRFAVGGVVEESAAPTMAKSRTLAYKRIAELINVRSNVTELSSRRFSARPDQPFNPPPNHAA